MSKLTLKRIQDKSVAPATGGMRDWLVYGCREDEMVGLKWKCFFLGNLESRSPRSTMILSQNAWEKPGLWLYCPSFLRVRAQSLDWLNSRSVVSHGKYKVFIPFSMTVRAVSNHLPPAEPQSVLKLLACMTNVLFVTDIIGNKCSFMLMH